MTSDLNVLVTFGGDANIRILSPVILELTPSEVWSRSWFCIDCLKKGT